jgi:hypothetical protein
MIVLWRFPLAGILTVTMLAAAYGDPIPAPPDPKDSPMAALVATMAEAMDDTKTWHLLPNDVVGLTCNWGAKPLVRLTATTAYERQNPQLIAEATTAWPVTFTGNGITLGDDRCRVLNSFYGYYDRKVWHPLIGKFPTWAVWLPEGPAYTEVAPTSWYRDPGETWTRLPGREPADSRSQAVIWQFHDGRWNLYDCSYDGMSERIPPENISLQAGTGGTMTAWMSPRTDRLPPHGVHYWDGRTWRWLTPADGLPDDPVVWAACVAPGKLWVATLPNALTFVDLAAPRPAEKRSPRELVESYLAAKEADRPALLRTLVLQRRPAIDAAVALAMTMGTPPKPTEEFDALLQKLRAALNDLQTLLAGQQTPREKIAEQRRLMDELTARIGELRKTAEGASDQRRNYDTLMALIATLSTGDGIPTLAVNDMTIYVTPVGLEPDGHAWIKLRRIFSSPERRTDENLVRLGPDGVKQVVANMPGLDQAGCTMSTNGSLYIALPDASGLSRWNGRKLVETISPTDWPKSWKPVAATNDGWIYAAAFPLPPGRSHPQYLLVRPDARPLLLEREGKP